MYYQDIELYLYLRIKLMGLPAARFFEKLRNFFLALNTAAASSS